MNQTESAKHDRFLLSSVTRHQPRLLTLSLLIEECQPWHSYAIAQPGWSHLPSLFWAENMSSPRWQPCQGWRCGSCGPRRTGSCCQEGKRSSRNGIFIVMNGLFSLSTLRFMICIGQLWQRFQWLPHRFCLTPLVKGKMVGAKRKGRGRRALPKNFSVSCGHKKDLTLRQTEWREETRRISIESGQKGGGESRDQDPEIYLKSQTNKFAARSWGLSA